MKTYTLKTLKEINQSYNFEHGVTESDVKKANKWVQLIENTRDSEQPQIGDIIEFTDKHGCYYQNAHIESYDKEDNTFNICECPSIPFIHESNNQIYTSTSGGAWRSDIPSNLKLIGQKEKRFTDWGSCGACGNGAIEFKAKVNVWEYIEDETLEFTTKTHDKEYFHFNEDNRDYKYIGDGKAYKDDIVFSAYLQTFRGVVKKGNWGNQLIVWTYQNKKVNCESKEEYDSIEGIKDTWLCNGIRECKRIYDDNNYTVITYIPPYEELYREEFGLDWRTHSELEYALNNAKEEYDITKILKQL